MPLYDWICRECENRHIDELEPISQQDVSNHACEKCGCSMEIDICPSTRHVPFIPYFDISVGEYVTSHYDRTKKMKAKGMEYCDFKKDFNFQSRELD